MRKVPQLVVVLGFTSLLTDLSSEMIYPLLPVFLTTVLGAGALSLGVVEGVAETTASLLKIASGIWADRVARRKPMVVAGYTLAGLARPLIGLAGSWGFVLAMRFVDRIGKGLRSSPRDALIADAVPANQRGAAFGFQRTMDHAGAVLGPLVAATLLTFAGFSLRTVFLCAAIPAILVIVVLSMGVHEPSRPLPSQEPPLKKRGGGFHALGASYRVFLGAILLFTLGNSTDAFLLLRMSDAGVSAAAVALLWSMHHVVKMVAAYFGGAWSDRVGRRAMVLTGWGIYSVTYFAFAAFHTTTALIAVFLVYGVYFGFCEPSEKAWVVDLAPKQLRGTALGFYNGVIGLGALPASLLFGGIWRMWGAPAAFITGALFALAAAVMLCFVPEKPAAPNPALVE